MTGIQMFGRAFTVVVIGFLVLIGNDYREANSFQGVGGFEQYKQQRLKMLNELKNKTRCSNLEAELDSLDREIVEIDKSEVDQIGGEFFVKSY